MRMSELSGATGIPVPTVKFYLREGLLPPGVRSGPNQADYSEEHVRRLRLICALREVGGLSVAEVGTALGAVDAGHASPVLGKPVEPPVSDADQDWARGRVLELLGPGAAGPVVANLVAVVATLRALGHEGVIERLAEYAALARATAEVDAAVNAEGDAETALVTALLGERLFAGLRNLALVEGVSG
jgi:DNA-binding transcriptional MerR regulator